MEGLTFSVIMFGVIMILFTFTEISFHLENRKVSKKEQIKKSKEERVQEYFDLRR